MAGKNGNGRYPSHAFLLLRVHLCLHLRHHLVHDGLAFWLQLVTRGGYLWDNAPGRKSSGHGRMLGVPALPAAFHLTLSPAVLLGHNTVLPLHASELAPVGFPTEPPKKPVPLFSVPSRNNLPQSPVAKTGFRCDLRSLHLAPDRSEARAKHAAIISVPAQSPCCFLGHSRAARDCVEASCRNCPGDSSTS